VNRGNPCVICEGDHKCSAGAHGLIFCGRKSGHFPGFVYLGQAKGDSQFALYRREGDPLLNDQHPHHGGNGQAKTNWTAKAKKFAKALTPGLRRELAESLGIPEAALDALSVGFKANDDHGECFTFPEMRATGEIVGIDRRYPDGAKKSMFGGKRGLTIPTGWQDHPGPVYVPEGPSDVLALAAMGLSCAGRPNNFGGINDLVRLFKDFPPEREIVVLGENDSKENGAWPGRDGAIKTASELQRRLGRPVLWALPPDEVKDVRAWAITQNLTTESDWLAAGQRLQQVLRPEQVADDFAELTEIVITTLEHKVNDEAVQALSRDSQVYQRGGLLVRVVMDKSPAAGGIRRPLAPRIDPLPPAILRERLSANARFVIVRETKEGEESFSSRPPGWCVAAVHARASWDAIRHLEAVVEYPVLRPNGTILAAPGFDLETGLLYQPTRPLPNVLMEYIRDVKRARDELLDVVSEFPFALPIHRAAWLAALLTPLARFAFQGPAPLFLVDSNVRGAGKGLLLDCIASIVTDEQFTVAPYTSDEDELRKRITSLAIGGDRLVLFDNLDGKFGNATLDACLTATCWGDRLLGVNRTVKAPLFMIWYATGNNVAIAADTSRRICHIRLESELENPENRNDFRRPNLLAWVKENRPRLLWAALAVLGAYCAAGRPDQGLAAWGSYQGWSGLVRNAVVWLGLPDPGQTRIVLQDQADLTAESMGVMLACWEKLDPEKKGWTAGEVIQRLFKEPPSPLPDFYSEMRNALESLLKKCDSGSLSYKLRSFRRRVFGGRFIDKTGSDSQHTTRWTVFSAQLFRKIQTAGISPASPASPGGETPKTGDAGDAGDIPAEAAMGTCTQSEGTVEDSRLL
jgi:hypothetical protein